MTDQQTYTNSEGRSVLTVEREETLAADLTITLHGHDWSSIPAYALLAMIDAIAPDAMRAYLRETIDAERLDAVPEADSPEDVDEQAAIELSDDIDTRLHVIERLAKILRAGTDAVEVCTLADWVIDR